MTDATAQARLARLPKTGDEANSGLLTALGSFMLGAALFAKKRRKEEDED